MVQTGAVNMLAQTLAIPDVGHRIRASLQARALLLRAQ